MPFLAYREGDFRKFKGKSHRFALEASPNLARVAQAKGVRIWKFKLSQVDARVEAGGAKADEQEGGDR